MGSGPSVSSIEQDVEVDEAEPPGQWRMAPFRRWRMNLAMRLGRSGGSVVEELGGDGGVGP